MRSIGNEVEWTAANNTPTSTPIATRPVESRPNNEAHTVLVGGQRLAMQIIRSAIPREMYVLNSCKDTNGPEKANEQRCRTAVPSEAFGSTRLARKRQ